MDEIGLMVTHVTEQGFAYFTPIGGWDDRLLLGQNVIAEPRDARLYGVVGALPPHITSAEERKKSLNAEDLFIDFGFLSKDEADAAGIKVGSVCTLDSGFQELAGGHLKGKAFDDRTGCNILVQTALNLMNKDLPHQVCFVWAVQEEVGERGATTAAYSLDEQYHIAMAIACENTTAADVPGVPPQRCPSRMGKGPAITLVDANTMVSKDVTDRLVAAAEQNKIPYQFKTPARGGTDAGVIHLTRGGIPSGVISVPGRYIHSPATIIDVKDLLGAIDLITAFILMP
jgi:putative aminopeptidase FrvX